MAGAFQSSGFQNSAYQTDAAAVASSSAGGRISGGTFSRGQWRELRAAHHAAQERAHHADTKRKRHVLDKAAKAAAEALAALRDEEKERVSLEVKATALRNALDAATGAAGIATVIEQSNRVVELAQQIIRQIEEDEEEAEVMEIVSLGLFH